MVIFPQVSATHQAGERSRLGVTFALYAAVVVAIAAALFVAAPHVVTLFFGDAFARSATALRWLSIASVALALRSFPIEVLRGIGRPGLTSIAEGANWVLFLSIVPAAAVLGGLTGTAAGVAIASSASLGVLIVLAARAGLLDTARPAAPRVEKAAEGGVP
jgi:O-antigen/teichoic acid export membrane protein